MVIACTRSNDKSIKEDSMRIADSIAKAENEIAQMEALRRDSLARVEQAKYDAMISQCEKAEKTYNNYARKYREGSGDYYTEAYEAYERYRVKYEALLEVIDNFTPEQFARVQEIERKLIKPGGLLWG